MASKNPHISPQSNRDQHSSHERGAKYLDEEAQAGDISASIKRLFTVRPNDLKEWGVAALIFSVAWILPFWLGEMTALSVPVVALLFGAIRRPRHLWGSWIASLLAAWLAVGVGSLSGQLGEKNAAGEPVTAAGMVFGPIPFTIFLVLLPLWIGRLIGHRMPGRNSEGTTLVARSE
jgi:hypothetical protein